MKSWRPPVGAVIARCARRWIVGLSAESGQDLWPRAIQRKAPQAVSPAGKESLADRDMAAGKRIDKSHANIIGPNHPGLHLAVVRGLPEEAREIVSGPHHFRTNPEIQSLENTTMRIERLITRVSNEGSRQHGGPHVLVLRWDEILDQEDW